MSEWTIAREGARITPQMQLKFSHRDRRRRNERGKVSAGPTSPQRNLISALLQFSRLKSRTRSRTRCTQAQEKTRNSVCYLYLVLYSRIHHIIIQYRLSSCLPTSKAFYTVPDLEMVTVALGVPEAEPRDSISLTSCIPSTTSPGGDKRHRVSKDLCLSTETHRRRRERYRARR